MNLTDIEQWSVEYVCLNLRAADRTEVLGLAAHDSLIMLGYEVLTTLRNSGRGRIAWHNGRPAAVIGFAEYRKGVWQAVLLGTDDFPHVAKTALKWFRATARELRDDFGARRVQVDSHSDHWEAHRFLRALGARHEGPPMQHFGKDGSAYQRFVWIAHENDSWARAQSRKELCRVLLSPEGISSEHFLSGDPGSSRAPYTA